MATFLYHMVAKRQLRKKIELGALACASATKHMLNGSLWTMYYGMMLFQGMLPDSAKRRATQNLSYKHVEKLQGFMIN